MKWKHMMKVPARRQVWLTSSARRTLRRIGTESSTYIERSSSRTLLRHTAPVRHFPQCLEESDLLPLLERSAPGLFGLRVLGRGEHRLREFPSRESVSGVLRWTAWSWISESGDSLRIETYEVLSMNEPAMISEENKGCCRPCRQIDRTCCNNLEPIRARSMTRKIGHRRN